MRTEAGEKVYTVSELNRLVRELIERAFPVVWVEGEIANFVRHTSGHFYFSLSDETGQLRAVMFRRRNQFLRFEPENGLRVLARGSPSVYERGGQYQIIVDVLEPAGVGPLELAFQQVRRKLEAEGLFDPERKKAIPRFPRRVGVVTSPTGAAIRDILQVIGRRAPWIEVILRPAQVQGEGSAQEIARAIDEFNEFAKVDVLIVGRGGGSLDDLWAFNEEVVARSVFRSRIPVVSGVGHEIDHTISDLVADRRGATPSAAAELVAPDRVALGRDLARLAGRKRAAMANRLNRSRFELKALAERWVSLRLESGIAQHLQRTDELMSRLTRSIAQGLERSRRDLAAVASRLDAVSPLAVLARGYCLCRKLPGMEVVTRAENLAPGDELQLRFHVGEAVCSVERVRAPREG